MKAKYEYKSASDAATLTPENQEAGAAILENFYNDISNCDEASPTCVGLYIGMRSRCYAFAYANFNNQISALNATTAAP